MQYSTELQKLMVTFNQSNEVLCVWLSVADPGGVHGFHGTPLSHESTADYVASY